LVVCRRDILQQPSERRLYFYQVFPVRFLLLSVSWYGKRMLTVSIGTH
jgi:hypothetical protein